MESTNLNVIKQIAILQVATRLGLKVKGKKAICFGGHDTDPSMSLVPAKNIWKCFGCERKGDSITLVMEVLQCDFKEALNWFAREFGVSVPGKEFRRRKCKAVTQKGAFDRVTVPADQAPAENAFRADPEVYEWLIGKCGEVTDSRGVDYLKRHGIPLAVANRFKVRELRRPALALARLVKKWGSARIVRSGLAWGDSVPKSLIWGSYSLLFPFIENCQVVYIQGRPLMGGAKFLGLRGVAKPLYNVDCLVKLSAGMSVHLCEGVPDALALEANALHALAVLGASSFRKEWTDCLMRYDVVVVPDGDSGGQTFLRTVSEAFRNRGKAVRTVKMPNGKDAADVLSEYWRGE